MKGTSPGPSPMTQFAFFNAEEILDTVGKPIYDNPDQMYFDTPQLGIVSPMMYDYVGAEPHLKLPFLV